jgi:two-component system, LytTR family, response regulator
MKDEFIAVIVDDERAGIAHLRESLSRVQEIKLEETAMSAKKGKEMILRIKPDLIFLDMEMPEMSGLDLLRDIKEKIDWSVKVVFYTAFDKFLLEALHESAFDYLLKPYIEADFLKIINRFFTSMEQEDPSNYSNQAMQTLFKEHPTHFLVPTLRGLRPLKVSAIGLFEYHQASKHWHAILEGERIALRRNTSADDILTLSKDFIQISPSQIINLSYLFFIEGNRCILSPPFDTAPNLSVSRNKLKSLQDRFHIL